MSECNHKWHRENFYYRCEKCNSIMHDLNEGQLKYNHVNFFQCPFCRLHHGFSLSQSEIYDLNYSGKVVKECDNCKRLYTIEDDGECYFVK